MKTTILTVAYCSSVQENWFLTVWGNYLVIEQFDFLMIPKHWCSFCIFFTVFFILDKELHTTEVKINGMIKLGRVQTQKKLLSKTLILIGWLFSAISYSQSAYSFFSSIVSNENHERRLAHMIKSQSRSKHKCVEYIASLLQYRVRISEERQ